MAKITNIDDSFWDQSTFFGRFRHFLWVTDPRTIFASDTELEDAKNIIHEYRLGGIPPGANIDKVVYAKKLYESAFHPDTGDKQNVFGRMSFQVPGGMVITGAMLQFYKTAPAVIFWQWVNQSFNALVNYTNRNAKSPVSTTQLGVAYVSATASALVTALACKSYWAKHASPFMQRYVPFTAVAAANAANIPMMRQTEIMYGVDLTDDNGNAVGKSRVAAVKGISQVVFSRIVMAAPGMLILPVIMERLEKFNWFRRISPLHGPIQVLFVGCFLTIMVPTACGLFPQNCPMSTKTIKRFEPELYMDMETKLGSGNIPQFLYFNKGL